METFVYWQLQNRLRILFTVISFSVLHRSFERGQQGYKLPSMKHVHVHMFMLTAMGNFSSLPSAFSPCRATNSRTTLVHAKHTAQSLLPTSLGSCWTRIIACGHGCSLFGSSTGCSRQCLWLSGFFPPHSSKLMVQLFYTVKAWLLLRELAENTSASTTQSHALHVLQSNLPRWDAAPVGQTSTVMDINAWNNKLPKCPALLHCLDPF